MQKVTNVAYELLLEEVTWSTQRNETSLLLSLRDEVVLTAASLCADTGKGSHCLPRLSNGEESEQWDCSSLGAGDRVRAVE